MARQALPEEKLFALRATVPTIFLGIFSQLN